MSVGLVLEGGSMRGMYTAGVIDVFLENNIQINKMIGVSAGVLFGINYMSNQPGRVIRYNKRFVNDSRYMGFKSLITTGNIINKDFAYYDIPFNIDVFDEETFEKSDCELYAGVTNVETGKPEFFKVNNGFEDMELLRATSSMPFVSKMVIWNGKKYLDGGISDSIPIEKCQELGCDKIIVVLTRPLDYLKTKTNTLLPKLFYRKYPNLVNSINTRYKRYNETLKKLQFLEDKKEIFVIRPSKDLHIKRIEKDVNKLQEMYDLGITDMNENLNNLKEYLDI